MSLKKIGAAAVPVMIGLAYAAYSFWPRAQADEPSFASEMLAAHAEATRPTGSFRATGGDLGEWEMPVTGCQSGQRHGFSGVILFDAADTTRQVRVIQTPRGETEIVVQVPGADPVVVTDCETADVQVERTGNMVNFQDELAGSVTLACANLSGTVTIPACY